MQRFSPQYNYDGFLKENLIILYTTNQKNGTNIISLHTSIFSIHSSYYFNFKINCSESYFTVTQLLLTLILTDLVQVIKSYVAQYIIKILYLIT